MPTWHAIPNLTIAKAYKQPNTFPKIFLAIVQLDVSLTDQLLSFIGVHSK